MPRLKKTITTAKRRTDTADRYYVKNIFDWVDPYPEVLGTKPEKMVFARLMLMQIPFEFQNLLNVAIPEISLFKDYRPDFILPHAKLIIEVQGSYWHSKPEAIEADSYKYALFTAIGYKVLIWWDYEIETNLDALFARDLNTWTYARGSRIVNSRTQTIDDLKGLRTMNTRKRKPYRKFVGTSKRKSRKALSSYGTR